MTTGFQKLKEAIFSIESQNDFLNCAMEIFNYQLENNIVYSDFVAGLGRKNTPVKSLYDIPFLPVEFFRNHKVISGTLPVEMIFSSSGTTGVIPGRHLIADLHMYEQSFIRSFGMFYGDPEEYLIAALLPSYTEREGSSLVYMVDILIKLSHDQNSGFYRDNAEELIVTIKKARENGRKVLLLGVSFALLDLAEKHSTDLSGVIIMETGGMKGRRKEITRQELHTTLKERFNVTSIHSEYGMTELLSQAYSKGEGVYYSPPWMKILIRDPQDPLTVYNESGPAGGISIIDLANIDSCSFISTGDLGRLHFDGGFEVLGRFDNSDIRGCNLLVE